MKSTPKTIWRKRLATIGLYLLISIFSINVALATSHETSAPPPATGGSSGSGSSSGGKVTQPPIIPVGSTSNQKLYLPHDTSQDSNMNYVQNRLLPGIATMIIGITGGLALLFVIISGIQLLTSYGDSAAAEKAKKTLTYALAGVVIAGLSYAIVAIVGSISVQ